jgi:hypothetical protein
LPGYCSRGGHTQGLTRQTAFAEEASFRQDGHYRFFALLGHDRELYLAALDVENRIRRISLRKDGRVRWVLMSGLSTVDFCEEKTEIEHGRLVLNGFGDSWRPRTWRSTWNCL